MSDIISFVVKIQDVMSGQWQKVASTTQNVMGKMEQSIAKVQSKVRGAGESVSGLNKRLDELKRNRDISLNTADVRRANREIFALENRIDKLHNAGLNRGGGGGMRLPFWMTAAAATAGIVAGTMGIAKAGANAERDLVGLTTFLGKDQAGKVYQQIQKDAASTPFGTKGLLSADRALISAGVAADKARVDVLGLANAIAATGGGDDELARMAQNMQQIKNAGVATAADIKQFGFAGINIYQLLANATGKTVAKAKDMKVTYDLLSSSLRKAMETGGLYAGAMEAQSRTMWGKWSTLMDNVEMAMANIGMSQSAGITGLIDKLIGLTKGLPAWAEAHSAAIAKVVTGIIGLVDSLISMVKWVYHNWYWLKYLVGVAVAFYAAVKVITVVTGVYNTLMMWAAMRTTLFAVAQTEAAVATGALNTALLAGPWGWVALGVVGVGVAITALISKTDKLKESADGALDALKKYGQTKIVPDAVQSNLDYQLSPGVLFNDDLLKSTFTAAEQKKYKEIVSKGAAEWVYKKRAIDAIRQDRIAEAARMKQQMVINMPGSKPSTGMANVVPGKSPSSTSVEETSSSITGGGKRSIEFNIRNLVENMNITGGNTDEQIANMEPKFAQMVARLLKTVPTY